MLEGGASLEGSEKDRPLAMAVSHRHPAMVELLLSRGADANATCAVADSELNWRQPHFLLPFEGIEHSPLHIACCTKNTPIVRLLLAAGASPNKGMSNGLTPLMLMTATAWFAPIADALIEAGADPTHQDGETYTALHLAASLGEIEAIRWLLKAAPSTISLPTREGRSPLHFAALEGHHEAVSILLDAGARHRLTPGQEYSPLGVAVVKGHVEVVRVMLAGRRGMDAVGGATNVMPVALAGALTRGFKKIMRMLLDYDDVDETCRRTWLLNRSALAGPLLHYAAGYIVPSSVTVLLQAGADETARDDAGQRAIDVIGTMDPENPPLSPLHPRTPTRFRDPIQEAEIRRTLLRAPAFRAVSLAWPAAAAATTADPAPTAPPRRRRGTTAALGVRVYRPESERFFAGLLWR